MYKLLLCVRYLRTKYIALACIVSVMLGVATMIVVNSVMAGFTNEMRDRLHNFLADIVVESRSMEGMGDTKVLMQQVDDAAGEYIEAMTPTVEMPGIIRFTDRYSGEPYTQLVQIHGIDPKGKALVGPLRDYLDSYSTIYEDGQVVREPKRAADEPLGWELTREDAEYRRFIKERDNWMLQQSPAGSPAPPSSSAVPGAASESVVPEFDEPVVAAADSATEATDPVAASESPAAADASTIAVTSSDSQVIDDPFVEMGVSRTVEFSTEPAAARIYLGDSVAGFVGINPETGKREKVQLIKPGDDVILSTVGTGQPPEVVKWTATVTDIFRSGMSELDGQIVLMNLNELQKNLGMITEVEGERITAIHIRLKNYDDAEVVVNKLKLAFPQAMVNVRTWEQKQGLLLSAVEVETAILNVLLFLIIAVAGFGILAIFFMIVVEKTRDIGILKSLGASSSGVMSIFLSYGLGLGIVGSLAGVAIGLVFVRYINEIEDLLSTITGRRVFDENIYFFHEIPTHVSALMVFCVAFGAIAIAVMASVLPARRASRLHPVRALRYE
ncbi:MAG: FtsX-like permease family protein [Planctomycetaceae bacterium]|nr:FtsX-like permease family protein [Planctomycetaceae bacterium]